MAWVSDFFFYKEFKSKKREKLFSVLRRRGVVVSDFFLQRIESTQFFVCVFGGMWGGGGVEWKGYRG